MSATAIKDELQARGLAVTGVMGGPVGTKARLKESAAGAGGAARLCAFEKLTDYSRRRLLWLGQGRLGV